MYSQQHQEGSTAVNVAQHQLEKMLDIRHKLLRIMIANFNHSILVVEPLGFAIVCHNREWTSSDLHWSDL